jgi:hypothetical protein
VMRDAWCVMRDAGQVTQGSIAARGGRWPPFQTVTTCVHKNYCQLRTLSLFTP